MTDEKGPRHIGRDSPVSGVEFAGIGVQYGLTIVIFTFVGVWLDQRLGTSWLVLVCVFLGAGGGFYSMYRSVMRRTARRNTNREPRT